MLNRLGHGLSYSQVLDLKSAMAEAQIQRQMERACLPGNIRPNVFAAFAWDKVGILEETLSKHVSYSVLRIFLNFKTEKIIILYLKFKDDVF